MKYLRCSSQAVFDEINARLLSEFKKNGMDASVWAAPVYFADSPNAIYIPVDDNVINGLTEIEKSRLVSRPLLLSQTQVEAGTIYSALFAQIDTHMGLMPYFAAISKMVDWGNFKALAALLSNLVVAGTITESERSSIVGLVETALPGVDWESTGVQQE